MHLPGFNYRFLKCKHIIAAEFASGAASQVGKRWVMESYAQTMDAATGLGCANMMGNGDSCLHKVQVQQVQVINLETGSSNRIGCNRCIPMYPAAHAC
jgi:hypothetical protein